VQEPEGGIDNTLAAAFAQVREQLAASEASDEPEAAEPVTSAMDAGAAAVPESGELDQPAPDHGPANASQSADVATKGALNVGPDTSADAISNSEEPAPEAAAAAESEPAGESEPAAESEVADDAAADDAAADEASSEEIRAEQVEAAGE
jgi:hypothetical protein